MKNSIIVVFAVAVIVPIIWALYEKFSYREALPDERERLTITPGPMSWFLSVFSFLLFLLFSTETIKAIIVQEDILFWLSLGPPLAALMGYGAYVSAITRLRVCGAFVERRGLKGWQQFDWDDVERVSNHDILGTRLYIRGQRPLPVWVYGRGSREVRDYFELYEKMFDSR